MDVTELQVQKFTSFEQAHRASGNQRDVPRYYRCRGNCERSACSPTIQIAAHLVEAKVIELLKHPWKIKGT